VTATAHLKQGGLRYNTGCAFVDIDNDGKLDLFVANYLKLDPATTPKPGANPYCFYRNIPVACGPRGLPFERNLLYRNNGDGTFSDISVASGIAEPQGHYGLGVLTTDINGDGLPDIYVACDQTPSLLYVNQGHGKFEDEAMLRGVALDANGRSLSGMGADAGDYDGSGRLSLFRSNFSDEMETLYRNRGEGNFDDVTLAAGLGGNTRFVGWGAGFFDYDNDGWPDLLLVNGHVFPEVDKLHIDIHFRDRAILYHNLRNGKFDDVSLSSGPGIAEPHAARGAAFADIDNDGSIEVIVNNQNEAPTLLKLKKQPPGHWTLLRLIGSRSNRSAVGARVKIVAGGLEQVQEVRSGGSYLSQNDFRLHFGLGAAVAINRIEIHWPSGAVQKLTSQKSDSLITIREP
ncbi:MAG TPA: CRTAC1 family protein, partial [Bryobacteraceae bacterium]